MIAYFSFIFINHSSQMPTAADISSHPFLVAHQWRERGISFHDSSDSGRVAQRIFTSSAFA